MTIVNCRGGCGKTQPSDAAASQAGWRWLELSKYWRCWDCEHELNAASRIVGMGTDTGDALPADSRGALKKETASTIFPPTVKG